MTTPEEFGQYLQNLIESYGDGLSIILDQYGIDEPPTPELLVAMYQEYGDQFSSALAVLGDGAFKTWPTLEHLEGKPLIDKISNAFGSLLAGLTGKSSSPAPTDNTDTDTKVKPKWTTKKMIITGIVVVVVLVVIMFIVKKFKKS